MLYTPRDLPMTHNEPSRKWRRAGLVACGALWMPFVLAAALEHRVRRILEDFWFWPGIVPGAFVMNDLYDESFAWFAVMHVVVWTLLARRRPRLAGLRALLCSAVSAVRLSALLAM